MVIVSVKLSPRNKMWVCVASQKFSEIVYVCLNALKAISAAAEVIPLLNDFKYAVRDLWHTLVTMHTNQQQPKTNCSKGYKTESFKDWYSEPSDFSTFSLFDSESVKILKAKNKILDQKLHILQVSPRSVGIKVNIVRIKSCSVISGTFKARQLHVSICAWSSQSHTYNLNVHILDSVFPFSSWAE